MAKCTACGKFLAVKGFVGCSTCPGMYHKLCAAIPDEAAIPKDWTCPNCCTANKDSNTPAKSTSGVQTVLSTPTNRAALALRDSDETEFRRELRQYMSEQREFSSWVRTYLTNIGERMDNLERRMDAVERRGAEAAPPGRDVEELQRAVTRLRQELNDRDQDALLADLDIGQLPEDKGENAVHTVAVLAGKLGVTLDTKDVVFAERVGAPDAAAAAAGRPRRLVVRLARRGLRDELLRAARVRRNITSADFRQEGPPRRVFVNERLTRPNRQLFHRVRAECQRCQWRYSWTRRGRVYARQADGKPAFSSFSFLARNTTLHI